LKSGLKLCEFETGIHYIGVLHRTALTPATGSQYASDTELSLLFYQYRPRGTRGQL